MTQKQIDKAFELLKEALQETKLPAAVDDECTTFQQSNGYVAEFIFMGKEGSRYLFKHCDTKCYLNVIVVDGTPEILFRPHTFNYKGKEYTEPWGNF